MPPGDECPATYFGYHRLIRPNLGIVGDSPAKRAGLPQNAFNHNVLTIRNFTFSSMQSQPG